MCVCVGEGRIWGREERRLGFEETTRETERSDWARRRDDRARKMTMMVQEDFTEAKARVLAGSSLREEWAGTGEGGGWCVSGW